MEKDEIRKYFCNSENVYYGHGIGAERKGVIESILKYGLRCSHGSLDYTTMALGVGSENLFDEIEDKLNNWQHLDSKKIVIASLPMNLLLVDAGSLYGKRHSAFYNHISMEEAENIRENELKDYDNISFSQGDFLRPEFIRGIYDANARAFVPNERYYENLPEEEKNKLIEEVTQKYNEILEESKNNDSPFPWKIKDIKEMLEKNKEIVREDEVKKENTRSSEKEQNSDDDDLLIW